MCGFDCGVCVVCCFGGVVFDGCFDFVVCLGDVYWGGYGFGGYGEFDGL